MQKEKFYGIGNKKILIGEPTDLIEPPRNYELLLARRDEMLKALRATLNEEQNKQYDDLIDIESDMSDIMEEEHYKKGFKLGLQLGAEVFSKSV